MLGLFTGIFPMIVLYLVAAIVIPEGDGTPGDARGVHVGSGQAAMVFGVLLVLVGIAGLATLWIHVQWEAVWPLSSSGSVAALVVASDPSTALTDGGTAGSDQMAAESARPGDLVTEPS